MKNIKKSFWGLLAVLTLLWLWADTLASGAWTVFALRPLALQYSGVLGMGVMSVAMMLAARPVFFEPYLGGLDKMYRLHKWLGISGLVIAVTHWLWVEMPKWMVGWGWLERPARRGPPGGPLEGVEGLLRSLRHPAEGVGEWAFYAAVALIVLALVKRFPYRYFFKIHHLLTLAYLVLVFHSVVLLQFSYWRTPLGVVMGLLMLGGSVAALVVVLRKVSIGRQTVGEIEGVIRHADLQVLEVDIRVRGRWAGHEAGQFAFVTFHAEEGAHPFTISSAWKGDGHIAFIIKELGDYTRTLPASLKLGEVVKLEGPYGRFNFSGSKPRQIWVGAGIGITPFIARMKSLARTPDGKTVDLFHPTAVLDETAMGKLQRDAQAAGVNLHVLWDARDGRLNAQRLCETVPDWRNADIWFCGPAAFGQALRRDLVALGLNADDFHQELFEMR
ncbi:MAG: ferric reductase-like transmembrane domain-containing protein [Rhodoferax sp.]